MKLIKPSVEIIEQQPGEIGMLKHIETCGRVAWKSEERITEDSYIKFIDMLKRVNHGSVLEHGTVYLYLDDNICKYHNIMSAIYTKYNNNKYSKVNKTFPVNNEWDIIQGYITTNYRVLVENNWLDDLKYQCEPTEFHEKRVTVMFICDRGILAEFTRHRSMSMTAESTRYCNYNKDKFGNELTFILPCWFEEENLISKYNIDSKYAIHQERTDSEFPNVIYEQEIEYIDEDTKIKTPWSAEDWYIYSLRVSELAYIKALKQGWKPQQARAVLPNSLKTELIMTGFVSDWEHFLKLRCDKSAHPQAQELANMLLEKTQIFN